MSLPVTPPSGWKIRQIPWLEPGTAVEFSGRDLTQNVEVTTQMTVGATLGRGGQAAVFSVSLPGTVPSSWVADEVVLRVSYQDDEYGRDPRRTSIYQRLASLRETDPAGDPLEGLLRLHAVGHLPPPTYLPGQELWAQVLDRGGATLQQWITGSCQQGLGPQGGVAVMLPIMAALALCHAEGIVHRDIKPGNVFVTDRCPSPAPAGLDGPRAARLFRSGLPFLRLGDLGSMTNLSPAAMARLQTRAAPEALVGEDLVEDADGMTHAFTTNIDTGPFTPPEVWTSAAQSEADPAGDVWQLAVTMFYACTGELPFEGWRGKEWRTDRSRYVQATQAGEPNNALFEELPDRLQYLLRWCLTPDPMDRPDLATLNDELTAVAQTILDPPAEPSAPPVARSQSLEPSLAVVAPTGPVAKPSTEQLDDETARVADREPAVDPELGQLAPREGTTRQQWLLPAAVAAVLTLVIGAVVLKTHSSGGAARVSTTAPSSSSAVPRLTSAVQHDDAGHYLSQILPQLFTDTPLAKRVKIGTLQEKSYQFCDPCVDAGLRLKVGVDIGPLPEGEVLTVNTPPQAQPVGPYLVLVTPKSQKFTANPLAADRIRSYPLASRYASAKYQQVVLVPVNRLGEGAGLTPSDRSWQTQVSRQGPQQLTFDIPGQVVFVTVLWFNANGVVGFNWFDSKHQRPTVTKR